MFPLYYSPESEDGKSSSFFDLYEIVKQFNMEHFLTVQFVSTVFAKIKEDYPNEPNAPVSLVCSLSEAELEYIHLNKTSALIEASLNMGAAIGGANDDQRHSISEYGRCD